MERDLPVRVRDRADDGPAGVLVEQVVADDERRTPALLFVARLGIKCQGNEVALARHVSGGHLPFPSHRFTERLFLRLVVLRHTGNHLGQIEFLPGDLLDNDLLLADDYFHIIANSNVRVVQHMTGKAKPLSRLSNWCIVAVPDEVS